MIHTLYKHLIGVLFLVFVTGTECVLAQETVLGQDELGGRKALVGPDCLVNQFASNVALLGGIDSLENLVDENLNNCATFTTGVSVGVTEQPLFSIKDMKNTYKAGTEAGFCMMSSESSGLLSLNVIQLFSIRAYNNGKLIATYPVSSGQSGSGVGLDLIKIPGTENLAVNLTCTPDADFDELYLDISGGLDVSVIKELKFKYAFVGKPRQCLMTTEGIKDYAAATGQAGPDGMNAIVKPNGDAVPVLVPFPIIQSELNKLIDDNTDNSCSVTNVVSIGYKGAVKLSSDPNEPICSKKNESPDPTVIFPAGSEVGFVYQNVSALNLKLGNYVVIKVFNTDGTVQEERVDASVLSLIVAEGGKMTSSVIAEKDFYAAEIGFYTIVNANLGNLGVYYGFVNEGPKVEHRCAINPTADVEICESQTSYQLMTNPDVTVKWSLDESSPEKNDVTVTSSGKVTFSGNVDSDNGKTYIFRATAVSCTHTPQCYELVTIHRGGNSYDGGCSEPLYNTDDENGIYELSSEIYESSGSLVSISNLKNPEYILNGDLDDYAVYTGGLSIASNLRVIGVKTKDNTSIVLSDEQQPKTKRIGFVVEANSTFLNADVLQFFQIRCYKDRKEVYKSIIDETNTVGVGLIGEEQSQKIRFSIEVPEDIQFDEFMLWTSGVLKLDLSELRIYYPFIEDASLKCTDPMKCADIISMDNGAKACPDLHFQTASVAGVIKDLGYLVDNDDNTYFLYQNTVQVGSGLTVKVSLGKTLDYHNQLGIIMDNKTLLAGIKLGSWITVETYCYGKATGDKFNNWGVLGLNLIGYGDKNYLICNPTKYYDEVRITFSGVANVLEGFKLYGLFTRNDKNLNGIPDCMDPDQNCSVSMNLATNKICVGNKLLLTGTFPIGTTSVTVEAPDQNSFKQTIQNASPEKDGTPFSVEIPTVKAGVSLPILVYGPDGKYMDGVTYDVHPLKAEWRVKPISVDWNEPNNWAENMTPYCCTNVIIPDGATMYPVLESNVDNPADTYCCDGIYFKADGDVNATPAQVINVPELAYHKAWVDVKMMPNRYYLFSAPLKNTHTGDLFVPAEMNGKQTGLEFVDLNEDNTPQNRFNPQVFQRKWHSTLNVRLLDNITYGKGEVRTDNWNETKQEDADWTSPFNALNHTYTCTEGFSVWVDNGNLDRNESVIFRLPKQHSYYNYYTPDGIMLDEYEGIKDDGYNYNVNNTSLSRDDNTRFIYEGVSANLAIANNDYPESKKYALEDVLKIVATINNDGKDFMIGNPFMSDIDIKTFLQENNNVSGLKRYNGAEYISYNLDEDGNLQSSAAGNALIEPLESFIVTSNMPESKNLTVSFTRAMMLNTVNSEKVYSMSSDKVSSASSLNVIAESNEQSSSILISDNPNVPRSERMSDPDIKPSVALSVLDENSVYDIYGTDQAEIPLVVQLSEDNAHIKFHFESNGAFDKNDWKLIDQYTGDSYLLNDSIVLKDVSTCLGRFVLQSQKRMNEMEGGTSRQVYVLSSQGEKITLASKSVEIKHVTVWGRDGKQIADKNVEAMSCVIEGLSEKIALIRVLLADGNVEQIKMLIQ